MESEAKATVENVTDMITTLRKVKGDPYTDAVMSTVKLVNFAELLMTQLELYMKAVEAVEKETGFKLNFEQSFNGVGFSDRKGTLAKLAEKAQESISYQTTFAVTALAFTSLIKQILTDEKQKEEWIKAFEERFNTIGNSMNMDIKMLTDKIAENPGIYVI